MDKSFTRQLAEFVFRLKYENLTQKLIDTAKICIYDALACSCGGISLPWSQMAVKLALKQSDNKEASIWVDGSKSSAGFAAFANAVLNHSIIYEDMHAESGAHLGTIVIPAALALGEKLNCSGKQVITAIIAGYEVMGRVGKALNTAEFSRRGFRPSGIFGPFGSAAVGAKLLNLREDQIVQALGFAGNCSAGVNEWAHSGSNEMYFHNGFASMNGLTAAYLAQEGAVASEWIIEGQAGLANAWAGSQEKLLEAMRDFGEVYEIERVYHKPAPACAFTQETTQAALKLVHEYNIVPEEIEQVTVSAYPMTKIYPGCDYTGPYNSFLQAQMSNQFAVASVILHKDVNVKYYINYSNPKIYDISRKIKIEIDPAAEAVYPQEKRSKVTIQMKNGQIYVAEQKDLTKPTNQEVIKKFELMAADVFSQKTVEVLINKINSIEQVDTISEITNLLKQNR